MKEFDISIAGEINLDLVLYGLPEAIPLEREILATDFQVTLGSSSAILAHNIGTLGNRVAWKNGPIRELQTFHMLASLNFHRGRAEENRDTSPA